MINQITFIYFIFNCLIFESRSLKYVLGMVWVVLVLFMGVCGVFQGPRKDMPICWNLARNQIGQNLVQLSSQRQKIN